MDSSKNHRQRQTHHETLDLKFTSVTRQVEASESRIDNAKADKLHRLESLREIPLTVQQPIMSDYSYEMQLEQQIASCKLLITIDNNTESIPLKETHQDTAHQAHPHIALKAKKTQLKTRQQFDLALHKQARVEAHKYLTTLTLQYKNSLLRKAAQTVDANKKFDWWVAHGLAGKFGASNEAAKQMQEHLRFEFGHGGTFNINSLLKLY